MTSEPRTSPLFTPQELCGDAASGLARHAVFLERAKAEAGRDELAVKVTLAAYLVVRLVDACLVAVPETDDEEGLEWQVGAVRRHVSELPADQAEIGHLVGIIDAVTAGDASAATLRIGLTAYAYYLEHEGRFGEALEVILLAARAYGPQMQAVDFAACALFIARLNRLLACWDEAAASYKAAEAAAEVAGNHVLRLRGRLGQGAVYRGQGNLPRARALVEGVLQEAAALELVEVQLIAYSDLSITCGMQGQVLDALNADYQAFLLAQNTTDRMRALSDLGVGFHEIGAYDAARLAFNIVLNSETTFLVRHNAVLELMDLESSVGNRVAFERLRLQADASRGQMPPTMVVDYLRKAGLGFARFGQTNRGRETLSTALALAETHRLNAWYFKIEAAIQELDSAAEQEAAKTAKSTGIDQVPVILEMEAGLREYAALQPA